MMYEALFIANDDTAEDLGIFTTIDAAESAYKKRLVEGPGNLYLVPYISVKEFYLVEWATGLLNYKRIAASIKGIEPGRHTIAISDNRRAYYIYAGSALEALRIARFLDGVLGDDNNVLLRVDVDLVKKIWEDAYYKLWGVE